MEDKELQELFEAKRTVEANRRRQAALEEMIAAHAGGQRKRRLWPVWAGAAAASVALILLTLPAMYHTGTEPLEVAGLQPATEPTTSTVAEAPTTTEPTSTAAPRPTVSTATLRHPHPADTAAPTPLATESIPEPIQMEPKVQESEPQPMPEENTTRRVLRRTSTMIACTDGCHPPLESVEPLRPKSRFNIFGDPEAMQLADNHLFDFKPRL